MERKMKFIKAIMQKTVRRVRNIYKVNSQTFY